MNRRILIAGAAVLAICLIVIGILSRSNKGGQSQADALYQEALSWDAKGESAKAIRLYQELIKQFPDSKQISEVERRLWDLNIQLLFSPEITEKDIVYKVEPGDTLNKIATNYNTTVDLIKRSNKLESDLIRPGSRLKLSAAKFSVIVDKSQNLLILKADDEIFKIYGVATGRNNCSPTGTFKVVEKLLNPDWYKSGEGIIPSGSQENILGSRWLGISAPQYGIHGGAKEEDLGQQVTNGCIRMTDPDVEELFTVLPRGSEVTIIE